MSEQMSDKRLVDIEAREKAATPLPWRVCGCEIAHGNTYTGTVLADHRALGEDLVFIASARTDVPDLLAEVRRLRGAMAESERRQHLLADAIVAAAVRAGIITGEQPMTGPEVLLIAEQLYASASVACDIWRAERRQGDQWTVIIASCNAQKVRDAFAEAVLAYGEEARLVRPDGQVESRMAP